MIVIRFKLGLARQTDSQLEDYTQEKILALNGNPAYPALPAFPELQAVIDKLAVYRDAMAKVQDGNTADTAFKNLTRKELQVLITTLATRCSQIADGNETVFRSSGFELRKKPSKAGLLPAPANFRLLEGPDDGQLRAKFRKVKHNFGYTLYLGTSPNRSSATIKLEASKTSVIIPDLVSGTKYYGWVRANGAENLPGEWSSVESKVAP